MKLKIGFHPNNYKNKREAKGGRFLKRKNKREAKGGQIQAQATCNMQQATV